MNIDWHITALNQGEPTEADVDFGATGLAEILQNVRTILMTPKGSQQMDRNFGMDMSYIDMPMNLVINQLISSAMVALSEYEPRVQLEDIKFDTTDAMDGGLIATVKINVSPNALTV
jgi:Bacteriophage baseplate protein W